MLEYKKIHWELIRKYLLRAHNSRIAKIRGAFFREEYALLRSKIKNQNVLVAGCGLGHDAFVLAKHNSVIGIDIIKPFVNEAQQRAKKKGLKINFLSLNFEQLPFCDNYFDSVILNMGTIGNFDNPAIVIQELLRVGKRFYFDFYVGDKEKLEKRKKMYEEESWSALHIVDNKIVNDDGFESKSFSKNYFQKIARKLDVKITFHPILDFAFMAEMSKK